MSIKVQLAELCAHRHLAMSEYQKLPAFSSIEQESDVVEKLEAFHLPEITKLICGSDILLSFPWATKYQKIREFYYNSDPIDVLQVISRYNNATTFASEILSVADAEIIHIFSKYYSELDALLSKKKKERTSLTKKINTAKKKSESAGSNSDQADLSHSPESANIAESTTQELTPDEKKLECLKKDIDQLNRFLKIHSSYIEKIRFFESKAIEDNSDENRENAYRSLNSMKMPYEEEFLNLFIKHGVIPEEFQPKFHDVSFVSRIMQCLDKGNFKQYALPILLKLYEEGVIDLIEGPASDFIDQHPTLFCDYLISVSPPSSEELDNSDLGMLIEKALQKEIATLTGKSKSMFAMFWNTVTDSSIWSWIICKINDIVAGENVNSAVSCVAFDLEGKAAKSFVEALFNESEVKVTTSEIISALLKSKERSERDVILETIRTLEQNNRKVQRRLNTSERKLRSQGQELFSSVYLPMEQLEELAINLKATNGEIKASLVGAHLIDIVLSLREGFESLALEPVVDMDDWRYQNKVSFDPNIHRINAEHNVIPNEIRLNTLGFRYQDDDGEWQQHNAHASVEMRKGYPKHEQPGQKKPRKSSPKKCKDFTQYFDISKKKP